VSVFATGQPSTYGLAFDPSGNLFAASYSTGTITEYTPDGASSVFASGFTTPAGLAFKTGLIYGPTPTVPEPSSFLIVCGALSVTGAFSCRRHRDRRRIKCQGPITNKN
jgi:hypothetical protein